MATIPNALNTHLTAEQIMTSFDNALTKYPATKSEVETARGTFENLDARLDDMDTTLNSAKLGIKYKGEVNYYADLPNSAEIGDAYTVKYAGSSGTTPDGTEYVWGTVNGTNQWINFSKDSYTKAEVDALLALKQNALTTAQLAAVNSGITAEGVAQIETNKNNILSIITPALKECVDNEKKNYLYYTLDILKVLNTDGTWTGNAFTHTKGVTFTVNSDMSISVSGTNNSGSDCAFLLMGHSYAEDVRTIPTGTYIASGCPTGGSNSTYLLYFWKGKTTSPLASYSEIGNSTSVYLDYTNANAEGSNISFIVKKNNTVNFTVYPMICKPDAWAVSHKYVPYVMSNAELTAAIQALQAQLANQ